MTEPLLKTTLPICLINNITAKMYPLGALTHTSESTLFILAGNNLRVVSC